VIDNGITRAALVAVDSGAVGEQEWNSVSQRIEKELGIPAQNLIINPVHTHSASGGTVDQIFSTIKAAKEKLQPARIGYGTEIQAGVSRWQIHLCIDDEWKRQFRIYS
jgi:neutral ceramidase